MVQHLPKALLLALLVATPGMAQATKKPPAKAPEIEVDYLKCDAMQKAKERIIQSSTAIKVEIAKAELGAVRATAGGPRDQAAMAELVARQDTYSNLRQGIGGELAVADMKKIQKVEADMRKAKCP